MREYKIELKDINEVGAFIKAMESAELKGELSHGLYTVNATSLMGILSMDLSKTFNLKINSKEKRTEDIVNALYRFIPASI